MKHWGQTMGGPLAWGLCGITWIGTGVALAEGGHFVPGWAGAWLAVLTPLCWRLWMMWRPPLGRDPKVVLAACVAWLGCCLAVLGLVVEDSPEPLPVLLSLCGLLLLLWQALYGLPGREQRPMPERVPLQGLEDMAGGTEGVVPRQGAALWFFFRGNHSPVCLAQLAELSRMLDEWGGRAPSLRLVTPQSPAWTRRLQSRWTGQAVTHWLWDRDGAACRALGALSGDSHVWNLHRDLLPMLAVIDGQGRVLDRFTLDDDTGARLLREWLRRLSRQQRPSWRDHVGTEQGAGAWDDARTMTAV